MDKKGILERDKSGEEVSPYDPEYPVIRDIIKDAGKIIFKMNSSWHDESEIRRLFSLLTGAAVDETFILRPPFYTDFGKNIRVGKNVFINHGCTFMDRGGIILEDDVLIAPKVNLTTTSHLAHPLKRRTTISSSITIKRNAWVGIGATILPGVTIGENSIVAASAVVASDVPANTVAAGVPAGFMKTIDAQSTSADMDCEP